MLSKEDMESHHINSRDLDCGDPLCRSALRELLLKAGESEGFDCGHGRMFIQLYPERDGGCEIFVTLLSELSAPFCHHNTETEENMPKYGTADVKNPPLRYRFSPEIYEFADFQALLQFCRRIDKRKKSFISDGGASFLYTEEDKKIYYLVVFGVDGCEDSVSEYGGEKRSPKAYAYIKEHCLRLCDKDALGTLGALL